MKTYCIVCKKENTDNINSSMVKTKNGRLMLSSQCSVRKNKKTRFNSEKDARGSGILSNLLGIKTPLSNVPGLNTLFYSYKMNEIINKFLLAGDKFMPEMHLRDPIVGTYSACVPFTKNKQRIREFMNKVHISVIFKNKLDEACFQHDMAYGDFKDLKRRTQSDKVLKNKAFKIASNPKYDGYQRGLASMIHKIFDKKSKGSGIKNKIKENQQLANELHKPIIKKLKKKKSVFFF